MSRSSGRKPVPWLSRTALVRTPLLMPPSASDSGFEAALHKPWCVKSNNIKAVVAVVDDNAFDSEREEARRRRGVVAPVPSSRPLIDLLGLRLKACAGDSMFLDGWRYDSMFLSISEYQNHAVLAIAFIYYTAAVAMVGPLNG